MHPPSTAIISRTFVITAYDGKSFNTAFAIPAGDFFYFITPTALFKNIPVEKQNVIYTKKNKEWFRIEAVVFRPNNLEELIVIKTNMRVDQEESNIVQSSTNITPGQDVYLLGFTFGLMQHTDTSDIYEKNNKGFPLPLVKSGIISGIKTPNLFIDAYVSDNAFGGPVICWDEIEKRQKVCGIINNRIAYKNYIENLEVTPQAYYYQNSGIATACDIEIINQAIIAVSQG